MKMNTKSKLALSLGLLVAPLALLAKTPEKAYVESYRGRTDIPVPISVVTPEVESRFAGQQVTLEFVVDATGKPMLISSASPKADAELVAAVTAAVAQWKFSPALVDGLPVARKVVLPVNIVDSLDNAAVVAMKE
ncbi:TonB family C-terminal domain-containing protein [Opitutus sp. GAS368]|jgi:TonB family protein|nr:TonB family C-terminal domain-containing protein [Opitutus sp. GAS368]